MSSMKEFMEKQKARKALQGDIQCQPEQVKVTVPVAKKLGEKVAQKIVKSKVPPKGGSSPKEITAPPKPKGPAQPPQQKKKKTKFWRPTCGVCQELIVRHRLPVGSKFTAEYVSDNNWQGTLTVPGMPSFNAEAVGLVQLNKLLDHHWQDIAFKSGERPYELEDNIKKMRQKKHEERQKKEHEEAEARKSLINTVTTPTR